MPWYIYYALKQLFPSKKVISYFSMISIIGVALGVSVLIIVQSVMNGFGENIRRHLAKTHGDILIYSSEGMLQDWGVYLMNSPVTHQSNRLALYRKHSDGSKRRGYGFPFYSRNEHSEQCF